MDRITADQLARAGDYLATFTTPPGVRVLADLRATCHDRLSYAPGDVYHTFVNEGRREIYLSIVANMALARDPTRGLVVEGGPPDDEEAAA